MDEPPQVCLGVVGITLESTYLINEPFCMTKA